MSGGSNDCELSRSIHSGPLEVGIPVESLRGANLARAGAAGGPTEACRRTSPKSRHNREKRASNSQTKRTSCLAPKKTPWLRMSVLERCPVERDRSIATAVFGYRIRPAATMRDRASQLSPSGSKIASAGVLDRGSWLPPLLYSTLTDVRRCVAPPSTRTKTRHRRDEQGSLQCSGRLFFP